MTATKEIRSKIQSIKNTQKITRAMEMVAASKMRRAQDRMRKAQPYAKKIMQVISHVARAHPEYRGLCGGLNTNLLKSVITQIKENKSLSIESSLALIGSKGAGFFKRMGGAVLGHADHLGDAPKITDLIGVVKIMLDEYLNNRIDALYLCSNEFVNTMTQQPVLQQILPIVPAEDEQLKHYWDYIYEPDNAKVLIDGLLTRYIESQVYRSVIENISCEQAARMVAMKSATDNASELISDLQLLYNKARQAAITQELSEIVAGAAVV
jgi:F-type H+-transporting ATPase subunit gamma